MSEKNSKGLAVGLLVVGLVAGLAGGYFLQVPEVNRLNTELSASEEARSELTNQVASLESSLEESLQTMSELQSDLGNAQDKISEYEYLSIQLSKDSAFLKLQGNARSQINLATTLEEVIAVWTEVQEASSQVDPDIADTIDPLIELTYQMMNWTEHMPSEYASDEEWIAWVTEGMMLQSSYILHYYDFEATYVNAIQEHVEALTGI